MLPLKETSLATVWKSPASTATGELLEDNRMKTSVAVLMIRSVWTRVWDRCIVCASFRSWVLLSFWSKADPQASGLVLYCSWRPVAVDDVPLLSLYTLASSMQKFLKHVAALTPTLLHYLVSLLNQALYAFLVEILMLVFSKSPVSLSITGLMALCRRRAVNKQLM